MLKRCVECKGRVELATTNEVIPVGEHRLTLTLPARRCVSCGKVYVDGAVAERADLLVASQLLEFGIATGAGFRFMRKALGLSAAELAELLDVDAATISRWETGKVPVDRCALTTLAAAASERFVGRDSTLARLRTLREGKQPGRRLHLEYANAS